MIAALELDVQDRGGVELSLAALVAWDTMWLRLQRELGQQIPPLYASGVRYARDGIGYERWKSIPVAMRDGTGDCKVLAAWRVAELRVSEVDRGATPLVVEAGGPYSRQWHVVVRRSDGSIEDPSLVLGMRGAY